MNRSATGGDLPPAPLPSRVHGYGGTAAVADAAAGAQTATSSMVASAAAPADFGPDDVVSAAKANARAEVDVVEPDATVGAGGKTDAGGEDDDADRAWAELAAEERARKAR